MSPRLQSRVERRTAGWLSPLARSTWLPWAVLAGLLLATAVLVLYVTRGTTLWFDDWTWALHRRAGVRSLLDPYNGHLSLVPILIYRTLFATAGIGSYVPYRATITVAHLACGLLVFEYARRRVGRYLALLAAALILFLGPAWQDILWPFQTAWLISVGAGVGALLALDREDPLGDGLACGLLVLSLASSSVGVAIAAGAVVDVAWGRRRWRDGWIVAVPIVLYGVWSLADQHTVIVAKDIFDVPSWAGRSAAASLSAVLGLSGQTPSNDAGTLLEFGAPLAVLGLFASVRSVRLTGMRPRVASLIAILVAFWVLTAIGRSFIGSPYSSRYLYVDCLFAVLLVAELARGARVKPAMAILLSAVACGAVLSNIGILRRAGGYLRDQAPIARADLAALDIAGALVPPFYVATSFPGYPFIPVQAGAYFAMRRATGSPAYSIAQLLSAPEPAREVADAELVRIDHLTLRPASARRAATRGRCPAYNPGPVLAPTGDGLTLTVPPGGILVRASQPVMVAVRRFGEAFHPLGTIQPQGTAALSLISDPAPQRWHVQLQTAGRALVCT